MLTSRDLEILYPKLLSKQISDQEIELLFAYFNAHDLQALVELVRMRLDVTEELSLVLTADLAGMDERVLGNLRELIAQEIVPVKKMSLRRWSVAIAAALALVIVGVFFFSPKHQDLQVKEALRKEVIVPGHSGATLTLANGQKIRLSDAGKGVVAREAGVVVSKGINGELTYEIQDTGVENNKSNTLSTAKGETYQLRLPDGSLVWLNAASSLTYSAGLVERGLRRVRLDGEAYFEIAKDVSRPFVVQTARQEVMVLGTHFNVSAYGDDGLNKATLLEGSVRINGKQVLVPGEQAVTGGDQVTRVLQVNALKAVAWKDGKFVFANERIEDIMRMLGRWYNVEVVFVGDIGDKPFTGSISRRDDINQILDKITYVQNIHFKVEGRRITVMR